MVFAVQTASDEDVSQIVAILLQSYGGTDQYINAVFPRSLTKDGRELAIQRILYIVKNVSGVWWEKIIDESTGEIIGGAMWNLCESEKPQAYEMDGPPGTWESEEDKRYAQALQRSFVEDENKVWGSNELPLLGLAMMAIAPEFQRMGAGSALVRSGLQRADDLGASTIVVSNRAALQLYEKFGFVIQNKRQLTVPNGFIQKPDIEIWTLLRNRVQSQGI